MKIKRGNIYLANLDPVVGSEQGGTRPVLVVQNNMGNKYGPTTIIAAITAKTYYKHHLPTHIVIPQDVGLRFRSLIMLEQIRVIDQSRLIKKVGRLSDRYMLIVDRKLKISLGIDDRKRIKGHERI